VKKIGLIAGAEVLPLLFCREVKKKGYNVIAVAIEGLTDKRIDDMADKVIWVGMRELGRVGHILRGEGVREAVAAGKIRQQVIYDREKFDEGVRQLIEKAKVRHTDMLLRLGARILARAGIRLLDARPFLEESLVKKGQIFGESLTEREWADVKFGYRVLRHLGRLDIGQTVVVRDKAVIAVEAMEGTDETIKRAGDILKELGKAGIVVVKAAKPRQDMRFDVPVVGPGTIDRMNEAGGGVLALEAQRCFILESEEFFKKAQCAPIKIVGI